MEKVSNHAPSNSQDDELRRLESELGRVNALNDFLKQKLTKEQDWSAYTFGGSKAKPTLLKGGAEKVAKLIGVNQISFEVNIQTDANIPFAVSIVCNLQSPNAVCQGVGYASAGEGKWQKQGVNAYNTVLKIAKKRAFVDAVLTMSGLSGYFTQDLEDMDGATKSKSNDKPSQNAKSTSKSEKMKNDKDEKIQVVDEDTGEIVEENGETSWEQFVEDSELYCNNCGEQVSEKVRDYSKQKYNEVLCYKCQQGMKGSK